MEVPEAAKKILSEGFGDLLQKIINRREENQIKLTLL